MKEIQIYTAAVDNTGVRQESGTLLKVGSGKTEIPAARAKAMVDAGTAVEINPVKASAKKSDD
ncbi:hypothetical protein [Sphingorhabdus sp. 109]|uniref:hypothetical protein n=1 Tax=Sphingorhabdus sp. 109 TaxID=2653173 RepID=UPI0012F2521F|nr:hypothetical protein [Sphingorhabdus sp. 109]VWX56715.1 hypothetical protein SPHINGOR109_10569 [Sphingorhabdus sp. 109]